MAGGHLTSAPNPATQYAPTLAAIHFRTTMVFKETLQSLDKEVKVAVDDFFKKAQENQKNENDILLVYIHAFQDNQRKKSLQKININVSEYGFGPSHVGLCTNRLYEFFDVYRHQIESKKKFTKELKTKKEQTELRERIAVDIELLIYLKFWESDFILKRLYNLTNLILSKDYEWDFDENKFWKKRNLIRREIQQPIKLISPLFHSLIEETYSAQIRNAVAHTKYFFQGRYLKLANKKDNKHYILYSIPFDEWEIRFHKVLLLYNHLMGNFNMINREHADKAKDLHNGLAVRTPKKGKLGQDKVQWIKHDEHFDRWIYNE